MTKIVAVLRRGWGVLLAGVVLGALAGAVSSATAPKAAEAGYRATQYVIANRAASQPGNVEQDALRVTRGDVAKKAAEALGAADPRGPASRVSAVADVDSGSIAISTTDKNPRAASERVDAFVDAFLDDVNSGLLADQNRRFAELQRQVDDAKAALGRFDATYPNLSLQTTRGDAAAYQALVSQRSELANQYRSAQEQLQQERVNAKSTLPYSSIGADPPSRVSTELVPVPTSMPFRMGLLGAFGLALAAGVTMVIERVRPRIDTRDELVAAIDFPVLAEVGHISRGHIPHLADGSLGLEGAWTEPYRRIRSAIQFVRFAAPKAPPKVFLFTSPSPGDGKSTTTAVTALALAETGQRTLVVNGDFRRPSVHTFLGAPATPGIREHARLDLDRPTASEVVHPTAHPHLFVVPAGAPGKEVIGLAEAACEISRAATREGAVVLIDTSPVEATNDTIDLLPVVDEVIVVVRSGSTSRKTLAHTVEVLRQHGASVMGAVLIGTPGLGRRQYYYEGYYAEEADTTDGGGDGGGAAGRPSPDGPPSSPADPAEPGSHAAGPSAPRGPQGWGAAPPAAPVPVSRSPAGVSATAPPVAAPPTGSAAGAPTGSAAAPSNAPPAGASSGASNGSAPGADGAARPVPPRRAWFRARRRPTSRPGDASRRGRPA